MPRPANRPPPPVIHVCRSRSSLLQRGAYAYRTFTFTPDGLLTSSAADHAAMGLPAPLAGYDPAVSIDRIVVLGLADGPQGWSAAAAAGGQQRQLEAGPGPLYNKEGLPEVALVVRKAGLPVGGDWQIRFSRAAGGGAATS